jgi:hypothetical protein
MNWILYTAMAACGWFILAFVILWFFAGVKRVNEEYDNE